MGHYEQERALQEQIASVLETTAPHVDVLDVELNNPQETVRVFIDTDGGVSLDTCGEVTMMIRDVTDHALEVSSPGETRPLRLPVHFKAYIGERARFKVQGHHKAFIATISDANEDEVTVTRGDGSTEKFAYPEITRCKLAPEPTSGGTT